MKLELLGPEQVARPRFVEVPKISCQGKVEVVKSILQERNSGRMEKQSRVMKVPKISCQENGEVFERM